MNQPTAKALSLPDDLKSHWQEAMAEKFPMNIEEACAYIESNYENCYTYNNGSHIEVAITRYREIFNPMMMDPKKEAYTEYVMLDDYKKSFIDKVLAKYKAKK